MPLARRLVGKMDVDHVSNVVKEAEKFVEFADKYIGTDQQMILQYPALWFMVTNLKAAVRGPEQLEFPFVY